jgi:RHS repeat-associated protein
VVEKIRNPLRFQGQYFDHETGLHYNRFRYYDPEIGRYLSKDPIGFAGGLNLHAYVANPTQGIDPLGLQGWEMFPYTNDPGVISGYNKAVAKMEADQRVQAWICRALERPEWWDTPGLWLADQRENGLDKGDDALAAAERFAMASEGFWDRLVVLGYDIPVPGAQIVAIEGKRMLQNARLSLPKLQGVLGKPGSRSPDFTEDWGRLGDKYYRNGYTPEESAKAICNGEK